MVWTSWYLVFLNEFCEYDFCECFKSIHNHDQFLIQRIMNPKKNVEKFGMRIESILISNNIRVRIISFFLFSVDSHTNDS